MRIKIKLKSGVIYSRDYPGKTYEQVCKIESEYMRKRGWTEVREITDISQFKIVGEAK